MAEVGTAYVRIRPEIGDQDRAALEELAALSRSLADGLDRFLAVFPDPPKLEETHD